MHDENWSKIDDWMQEYGDREVILLFYYKDMKISDIAQILDLSEGTVKSRLSRGRKKLEKILREEGLDVERQGNTPFGALQELAANTPERKEQ